MTVVKKNLVGVYGSLRESLGNHYILKESKKVGQFDTDPIYSLYDLGYYPGLKEGGDTSVLIEVYEVNDETMQRLDRLEGFISPDNEKNLYNKKEIDSPFGKCFIYLYNAELPETSRIENGDWTDYHRSKIVKNLV